MATTKELAIGADVMRWAIELLTDISGAYAKVPDNVRGTLNRTLFERVYLDEFGEVASSDVQAPFRGLVEDEPGGNGKRPDLEIEASDVVGLTDLLARPEVNPRSGSSKAVVAEDRGFEPLRGFPQHAFQACALGH